MLEQSSTENEGADRTSRQSKQRERSSLQTDKVEFNAPSGLEI